jgi:nitrate reductase NapE component
MCLQDAAREIFLAKQTNERSEKWVLGNFMFFRMHRITDIYFVGGFGTVQWIDVDEYLGSTPDAIATNQPYRTLQVRQVQWHDAWQTVQCICCSSHSMAR